MCRLAASLVVMALLLGAGPGRAADPVPVGFSDAELTESFLKLALGSEFAERRDDPDTYVIRKWHHAPALLVFGNDRALHQRMMSTHVDELAALTGLPMRIANVAHQDIPVAGLNRRFTAGGLVHDDPEGRLFHVRDRILGDRVRWRGNFLVFVGNRADIPDWRVQSCIVEELTQALGLPNDANGENFTMFNDRWGERQTALTPQDRLFVRLLYDRNRAAAAARLILAELRPR